MDDEAAYRIRLRAHELWAQGGRLNASSLAYLIAAEAELESTRGAVDADQVEQGQTSRPSGAALRAVDPDPSPSSERMGA